MGGSTRRGSFTIFSAKGWTAAAGGVSLTTMPLLLETHPQVTVSVDFNRAGARLGRGEGPVAETQHRAAGLALGQDLRLELGQRNAEALVQLENLHVGKADRLHELPVYVEQGSRREGRGGCRRKRRGDELAETGGMKVELGFPRGAGFFTRLAWLSLISFFSASSPTRAGVKNSRSTGASIPCRSSFDSSVTWASRAACSSRWRTDSMVGANEARKQTTRRPSSTRAIFRSAINSSSAAFKRARDSRFLSSSSASGTPVAPA